MNASSGSASDPVGGYPDLAGQVALVTGGSGGIGAATCLALAANGVAVAVNGRRLGSADAVVDAIRAAGGTALAVAGDCSDSDEVQRVYERTVAELGPIGILCAFAGGGRPPQPITTISVEEWRDDIDRNLTTTFLAVRRCLEPMMERQSGSIVTMASGAARQAGGAPVAYAAAKAGVVNFTRQAAFQAAPYGVRVNCIAPAAVMTDALSESVPIERQRQLVAAYPVGRLGRPTDIASATLFLASRASSWITGITLDVAGGQIMR